MQKVLIVKICDSSKSFYFSFLLFSPVLRQDFLLNPPCVPAAYVPPKTNMNVVQQAAVPVAPTLLAQVPTPRTQSVLPTTTMDAATLAVRLMALQQAHAAPNVPNFPQAQLGDEQVTMSLKELQEFVMHQGRRLHIEKTLERDQLPKKKQ